MKKKHLKLSFILAALGVLYGIAGCQKETSDVLPAALLYQNEPIKGYCLLDSTSKTISLPICEKKFREKAIIAKATLSLGAGWYGAEYQDPKQEPPFEEYCYWSYVGALPNGFYLIHKQEGCYRGTGRFSQLVALKREGDILKLQTIDGGDRSFGGIQKPSFANHKLVYAKAYTPADLFELWREAFHPRLEKPVDIQSLRGCAICQTALVSYEIPENDLPGIPTLQHIAHFSFTLGDINPDVPLPSNPETLQECFDVVLATYRQDEKLSFKELDVFFQKVLTLYSKAKPA